MTSQYQPPEFYTSEPIVETCSDTCNLRQAYVVNANDAVIVLPSASALKQTLGQIIALLGISFQGNQLNTCKLNIYHFHHRKIQHNFLPRKIESITENWLALEDEDDDSDEEEEKSGILANLFEEYDDDNNTDVDSGEEFDHIFDFF